MSEARIAVERRTPLCPECGMVAAAIAGNYFGPGAIGKRFPFHCPHCGTNYDGILFETQRAQDPREWRDLRDMAAATLRRCDPMSDPGAKTLSEAACELPGARYFVAMPVGRVPTPGDWISVAAQAPHCHDCSFYRPMVQYEPQGTNRLRFCQLEAQTGKPMRPDFSCFRARAK